MKIPSVASISLLTVLITQTLLAQGGDLDPSFKVSTIQGGSIALQSTGDVLLQVRSGSVNKLVRLGSDGTPDTNFLPAGSLDGPVNTVRTQADDKILINGSFTHVEGVAVGSMVRLNADGTLDPTFSLPANSPFTGRFEVIADGRILANLPDGKGLERLNVDGSVDSTFNLDPSLTFAQYPPFAVQQDGRILVISYPADGIPRIARLNPDGGVDASFQFPDMALLNSAGLPQVVVDSANDVIVFGSTVVGDSFDPANYTPFIHRFNPDGSADAAFGSPTLTGVALNGSNTRPGFSVVRADGDGKLLVGGNFTGIDGATAPGLARLNQDGTLDPAFNANGQFGGSDTVPAQVNDLLFQGNELLVTGYLGAGDGSSEGAALGTVRLLTGDHPIVILPPPMELPELSGKLAGFKATPSSTGDKLKLKGTLTLKNTGMESAKHVTVGVFASDDLVRDANDERLGTISLADLGFRKVPRNGGKAGPAPFKLKLPADQATELSGKNILLVINPDGNTPESDTSDNTIVAGKLP